MYDHEYGREAVIIGSVTRKKSRDHLILNTAICGTREVDLPTAGYDGVSS